MRFIIITIIWFSILFDFYSSDENEIRDATLLTKEPPFSYNVYIISKQEIISRRGRHCNTYNIEYNTYNLLYRESTCSQFRYLVVMYCRYANTDRYVSVSKKECIWKPDWEIRYLLWFIYLSGVACLIYLRQYHIFKL